MLERSAESKAQRATCRDRLGRSARRRGIEVAEQDPHTMPTVRLLFLLLAAMLMAAKAVPSDQVDACLEVDYAMKECAPGLPARHRIRSSSLRRSCAGAVCAAQTRHVARTAATKSRGDGAKQS